MFYEFLYINVSILPCEIIIPSFDSQCLVVQCFEPLCVSLLMLTAGQTGSNPGLQALWDDERQRRMEKQLPCDLEPPSSPGSLSLIIANGVYHFAVDQPFSYGNSLDKTTLNLYVKQLKHAECASRGSATLHYITLHRNYLKSPMVKNC